MNQNTELNILTIRDYIINSSSLVDYRYQSYAESMTELIQLTETTIKLRWDFNYILLDLYLNHEIIFDLLEFLNFRNVTFLTTIIDLNILKAKVSGNPTIESSRINFCYSKENTHEVHLTIQGQHYYFIDKDYLNIENNDFFDLSYIFLLATQDIKKELAIFFNILPEDVSERHFEIAKMYTE